jgi:hypothetical protein
MELTQFILPLFVALEIALILGLYRWIIRDWIIDTWEAKIDEEGWLVEKLDPVINEIEDRTHDKLQAFQDSFFGSIGAMTQKAQKLDPMNGIRKAAKAGDWTSMLVEYAANKANLGSLIASQQADNDGKVGVNSPETGLKPQKIRDLLNK